MMGKMGNRRSTAFVLSFLAACLFGVSGQAQGPPPAEGGEYVPRPQDPKPPLPYTEEDVSYANTDTPDLHLSGTFSKPEKGSPWPAVLLVSGAGPQDRDETMAGHKPFLVLADYLVRHGIAVLRFDDRGTGKSTGKFEDAATKDFASDAAAGFQYLTTRPDVDKKRIGLIGHGEGAIAAAIVAAANPQVALLVLLNGTAVTGDKVLLAQAARAERAAGLPDEQIEADVRIGSGVYRLVREGRTADEIREALSHAPPEYAPYVEAWKGRAARLESPWLRFFLTYDPSTALEKIQCPVLALFGEKDMTIDPDQNASAMKSAFSRGHNRNAKIKTLSNLNYLLQKANTGMAAEYSTIQQTMSPVALEAIETWISKGTS
jgi:pimeloyl-ACP methyl ester carboxylesterase